jgi:predicted phosphodiesterase
MITKKIIQSQFLLNNSSSLVHFSAVKTIMSTDQTFIYHQYPKLSTKKCKKSQIPPRQEGYCRFLIISDTHTKHEQIPFLPECDIFVHCGDILRKASWYSHAHQRSELTRFNDWLATINARVKIVIAGNHDALLGVLDTEEAKRLFTNAHYAVNESIEVEGIRFYATPQSHGKSFNKAFQSREFAETVLQQAPSEVDILISHGSCPELTKRLRHKLHFYGHYHWHAGIHLNSRSQDFSSLREDIEDEGEAVPNTSTLEELPMVDVCACTCDGHYEPVNPLFIVDYPLSLVSLNYLPKEEENNSTKEDAEMRPMKPRKKSVSWYTFIMNSFFGS